MNAVFHRETFLMHNGPAPWPCYFCDQPVAHTCGGPRTPDQFMVHHIDGDHSNNVPMNLVASHHRCHSQGHGALRRAQVDVDLVCDLYQSGLSSTQVADYVGTTKQIVLSRLHEAGLVRTSGASLALLWKDRPRNDRGLCVESDCENLVFCKSLCGKHYQQHRKIARASRT